MDASRILIVDDDAQILRLVSSYLGKHGFRTDCASDAGVMRAKLEASSYDLVVLDVMMPGEDGLSALRTHVSSGGPPVIMLSAIATATDRIVGLEMGAKDYLAKPCNPRELLARIRATLRHRAEATELSSTPRDALEQRTLPLQQSEEPSSYLFAGWRLDPVARTLRNPAEDLVNLSNGEFRLLYAFLKHPRRVLTRDQLLDYARGMDADSYDRAIDVQISRLRRKLNADARDSEIIRTVRNEGYMFAPQVTRG